MPYIDITGKRFGRYTVLRYVGNDKHDMAIWECKCDCGKIKNVLGTSLRQGLTVSCGCYHKEDLINRLTTHGMTNTRIRRIWNYMKQRCYNPHHKHYKYYGGKGVTVCDEWLHDFLTFYNWSMANGYDDTLTIDRIDSNKGYNPSNCRWVSQKVQTNNQSRNIRFEINGVTHTLAEWCDIYNAPQKRVRRRVCEDGWDILKALTTPKLKSNGQPA